jgi:acetyltransferase-like isoleucine patch superfamily enzyme
MKSFQITRKEYEKKRGSQNRFQIFFCKLCGLLMQIVFSNKLRVSLCKSMGVNIGKYVFLGKYCIIDDNYSELISIEDNVVISFGVTIITHDYSKDMVGPVTIKKGAFLGARSVILPGVAVGEKSIVGAGAVVTKDVPVNTTVVGAPARAIQNRTH